MSEQERKKLADAPKEKTFRTRLGKEIKNLKELSNTLEETPAESFREHVNDQKNDFANWIKNVLEDKELAEELYKTTEFKKTKQLVSARIQWLEKQIKKYEQHDKTSQKLSMMTVEKQESDKGKPKNLVEPIPSLSDIKKEKTIESQDKQESEKPDKRPDNEIISAIKEVQNAPAPNPEEKANEIHPVSHFKSNVHQVIMGILIGLILGIVIGFSAATFLVCGR